MIEPLPTWPLAIEFQQPEVSFVTPQLSLRKAAAVVGKPIVELIDDEDKFEEQES